ncbi:MAG: PHP domain-containing protein [Actinobacteria bacterium]|nr:PHP domain-containing protein [Actinomycetota bacterium]
MDKKDKSSYIHHYKGSFHLHSNYSDGTGTFKEIAMSAKKAGLDFLIVTDHGTLQPLRDGLSGYLDDILVLVGYEIGDEGDKNHLIALDLKKEVTRNIPPLEYVKEVSENGGIGIIAHPYDSGTNFPQFKSHEWNQWNAQEFDGIEIWNYMAQWLSGLSQANKLFRFLFPDIRVNRPSDKTTLLWDELNRKRKVFGIFATDNHGFPARFMKKEIKIFPYTNLFNTLRVHILLNEPLSQDSAIAQKQVIEAIREHRFYNSDFRHGDANGFEFYLACPESNSPRYLPSGSRANFSNDYFIEARAPKKAAICVLKNGKIYKKYRHSKNIIFKVGSPGNYRIECRRHGHIWIMSNNIYIK